MMDGRCPVTDGQRDMTQRDRKRGRREDRDRVNVIQEATEKTSERGTRAGHCCEAVIDLLKVRRSLTPRDVT